MNRRLVLATVLIFLVLLFAPIFFWLVEHGRSDDVHSVGRRVRLALPHAVREQLAVQAEEPVRVPVVLDRAGRRREPRRRSRPRPSRHGSSPPSSSKEQGWGRTRARATCLICGWSPQGLRDHPRAAGQGGRGHARDRDPRRPRGRPRSTRRASPSSAATRAAATTSAAPASSTCRRSSCSPTSRTRATSPTTSTPARCSRPSRSRPINHDGVLVRRGDQVGEPRSTSSARTPTSSWSAPELTGALLAASARTHGLTGVIADLLTHPEGQELYRVPVPPELVEPERPPRARSAQGRARLVARRRLRRRAAACSTRPYDTVLTPATSCSSCANGRSPCVDDPCPRRPEPLDVLTARAAAARERAGARRGRRRGHGRARRGVRAPARRARPDRARGAAARRRARAHAARAVRAGLVGRGRARCASRARTRSRTR